MVVVVAFQLQVMQVVTNLVPVFPVVSCENRTHVYIRSYVESSPGFITSRMSLTPQLHHKIKMAAIVGGLCTESGSAYREVIVSL